MTLPDHGRDSINDLVGTEVVQISVCHRKRRVAKLPLNDADIDPTPCQFASARVPKAMDVDSPIYAPEYRVTSGQFTHIAGVEATALVACEEQSLCIIGPGGYPVIKLPRCLSINPDYPALAAFTLEYSDGSIFRVDVAHPEAKHFLAPQLCPECQKKDATVAATANRALRESGEEGVQLSV
jgi:hypothetical protein